MANLLTRLSDEQLASRANPSETVSAVIATRRQEIGGSFSDAWQHAKVKYPILFNRLAQEKPALKNESAESLKQWLAMKDKPGGGESLEDIKKRFERLVKSIKSEKKCDFDAAWNLAKIEDPLLFYAYNNESSVPMHIPKGY